ncbi:MAG: carboxypeptidase-like regulatory domain-containing protein, partial [Cyclobacteriaceae bacterium]
MIRQFLPLLLIYLFLHVSLFAQSDNAYIYGKITDVEGEELVGANVYSSNLKYGVVTTVDGNYRLDLPAGRKFYIKITHLGYISLEKQVRLEEGEALQLDFKLETNANFLKTLEVTADKEELRDEAGVIEIDPMTVKSLPSAFQDFTKILVTLPGVYSNNELSSTYSVRGGNFDENLVYVNNIPVYRSFLANTGRQEGLSFVNPDMVSDIVFSAGGWQPKYGDALSSVLSIQYKKPDSFSGSATAGFLGGSFHLEGSSSDDRVSYIAGARHKDSRYLLGTLETNGQFLPRYTDFQSFVNFDLSSKESSRTRKTELGWLFSYARNRFLTLPTTQETEFGSISANFRFLVAFQGRESLNYDTWQSGFNLSHWFSEKWKSELILSRVYTSEREFFEVEGAYRLCDVNNNPGSSTFNECATVRAVGSIYESGRNR